MAQPQVQTTTTQKFNRARTQRDTSGPFGPSYEEIARRAYEIWESRGGGEGHHEEDWYQAERELRLGKH